MTLRCRPGDLAVIRPTWSVPAERGALVHVIRRGVQDELGVTRGGQQTECTSGDAWLCESRATEGFPCFIRDSHLRPIRDSDGTDEMLLIAGKPTEEVTQ